MSEARRDRRFATILLVGALLWAAVAFAVGYIVGAERQFSRMPLYRIGQDIGFDSKAVTFIGFSPPERTFRWSEGRQTSIVFRPEKLNPSHSGNLTLTVTLARSQGQQAVSVALNGHKLGDFVANGGTGRYPFAVPREFIKELKDNEIQFTHPTPRRGGDNDPRQLAIALAGVGISFVD